MHQFETLAGIKHKGCIPISVRNDDKCLTAIEIAKTTCTDNIMLFKKYT